MNWFKFVKPVLFLVFFFGVYIFYDLVSTRDRIPPGILVLNQPVDNLSRAQVEELLKNQYLFNQTIVLQDAKNKFYLDLSKINTKLDFDSLFSQIYADYHQRRLLGPLSKIFPFLKKTHNYPLSVTFDAHGLNEQLKPIQDQTNADFHSPSLTLQKGQLFYKAGELGRSLDVSAFTTDFQSSLSNYDLTQPIFLKYTPVGDLPTEEQIQQTKANAQTLIGKSIILTLDDRIQTVSSDQLIQFLDFSQSINSKKIAQFVENLSKTFSTSPINASFKTNGTKVVEFVPGRDGISLNTIQTESQLKDDLSNLITGQDTKINRTLNFFATPPQIKNEDVNNLGIKELLGRGKSTFSHSSAIRNINVSRGAQIVNNILVAPGETFSFNANLGTVDEAHGFKQAYVIKQGRTEMDVGGGICQVSTTLFRAILNSGLNITARQNHAYRVRYYEEDMPPGYDATVFLPSPDLRFINDTKNHILIQSTYNGQVKSLVYEIWGTKDGRQISISNYKQWGATPPPPARYEDDPTLPAGKLIQTETAVPGLKTSFDWLVQRNGEILQQRTFTSSYTPWAAVYRRGAASNI